MDYDRRIGEKRDCVKLIMDEIPDNLEIEASVVTSNIESIMINNDINY